MKQVAGDQDHFCRKKLLLLTLCSYNSPILNDVFQKSLKGLSRAKSRKNLKQNTCVQVMTNLVLKIFGEMIYNM